MSKIYYILLAVKAVTSMSQKIKLLLSNSDYTVRVDDLVSFNNDLYRVIDKVEWPQLSDDTIIFLSKNVGIDGEIDGIFHKSAYTEIGINNNEEDAE